VHQLLWLESLLKLSIGAILLLVPLTAIRILGLPAAANGFWPRMLGVLLIGIGAAAFIEGAWEGSRGIGLAGLVIINLLSAAVLAFLGLFGGAAPTRRGAFALWSAVVLLFVLSLFEIVHA
jgi:hypothetical protein